MRREERREGAERGKGGAERSALYFPSGTHCYLRFLTNAHPVFSSSSLICYPIGKTMSAHIAMQVLGATTSASGNGPSYDVW